MRRKSWLAMLGAAGLVAFALLAWMTLRSRELSWESADEFVLYSVDGRDSEAEGERRRAPATGETLHGYPVLGKLAIDTLAERQELVTAFLAATSKPGPLAACFWPRHVIRLRHGMVTTDYVICFQCSQYQRWTNGERQFIAPHIDRDARPAFDAPLLAAGVPIAPD